jgi:hypothetical protein
MDSAVKAREETKELVTKCLVKAEVQEVSDMAHKRRVSEVTGVKIPELENHSDHIWRLNDIKKCQDAGFHAFVDDGIFKKFKYCAGIRGSIVKEKRNPWSLASFIFSVLGLITCIPLTFILQNPAFMGGLFLLLPPIILQECGLLNTEGYMVNYAGDIPEFAINNMEKISYIFGNQNNFTVHSVHKMPAHNEILKKLDPVLIKWFDSSKKYGVVVAVWDYDNEIAI